MFFIPRTTRDREIDREGERITNGRVTARVGNPQEGTTENKGNRRTPHSYLQIATFYAFQQLWLWILLDTNQSGYGG